MSFGYYWISHIYKETHFLHLGTCLTKWPIICIDFDRSHTPLLYTLAFESREAITGLGPQFEP